MGSMSDSETLGPEYGVYREGADDVTTPDEGEVRNGVSQGHLEMDGKYFRATNETVK